MEQSTLSYIADNGTELQLMRALRHKIADTIDQSASGRDIAALSRQLRDVNDRITELEATDPENGETVLERVRRKAAERRAQAAKEAAADVLPELNDEDDGQ